MADPLLQVQDLAVAFPHRGELVPVVEGVSFTVEPGETLALVGESGCGKSVTGLSLIGLLPGAGKVTGGSIRLEGKELTGLPEPGWESIRGAQIGMVFQDPLTALDPVYPAGETIAEGLRRHRGLSRSEAWKRAISALEEVGIADPPRTSRQYPHQLSGGMRQRVMIASALALQPRVLIADEPTTALDVTVQAQILDLLEKLQREHGTAILLITHDLGVVARSADRVAVMYAGQVVEQGSVEEVLATPAHPYTAGLIAALPRVETATERLTTIPGTVPPPEQFPEGCRFRPRCFRAGEGCELPQPLLPPLEQAGRRSSVVGDREGSEGSEGAEASKGSEAAEAARIRQSSVAGGRPASPPTPDRPTHPHTHTLTHSSGDDEVSDRARTVRCLYPLTEDR